MSENNSKETALAKHENEPGGNLILRTWEWLPTCKASVATSLNLETREGKQKLVRAMQTTPLSMAEVINTTIEVQDVLCHPARKVRADDGLLEEWTRIVIFTADGRMIACGSQGIEKSLQLGFLLYGAPPWTSARCTVKQEELDGNKRWLILEWDLDAPDVPRAAKTARGAR